VYITADHGHMNMEKGISVYGTHVYDGNTKIPLITPRIDDQKVISMPISNIQLKNIILDDKINDQKFVYSDNQYYLQRDRKLMIRKGNYKYIYNKRNKSEELYDVVFDPKENVNLLLNSIYNRNRKKNYFLEEVYYYPFWEEAHRNYVQLKNEKIRIWKDGTFLENFLFVLKDIKTKKFANVYDYIIKKTVVKGRWNSQAYQSYYEK
jgi:arylsulfatase A-like enzyme